MLNVAFSNESLWFSDFMPRAPLLWIIHWQIKHEFCCFVFLSTLTRPEFTIWVQANLKTSEKEGGRCRRRWRNSPSNPGWVSEWVRDRAGADELKRERARLGAHVQFFHAGCSPCSPIILRVSPHSFSLPVFTCAPDPQLSSERTLQGKNRPKPPWNRNTTRETGENKTSLIFFSLFSPSLFF